MLPPPPRSTLFPYTTLFRSRRANTMRKLESSLLALLPLGGLFFVGGPAWGQALDRKSTRLNSSHVSISYAVFCLKKKIERRRSRRASLRRLRLLQAVSLSLD